MQKLTFDEALLTMGESIEDMEREFELKDNTKICSTDGKGISLKKYMKQK